VEQQWEQFNEAFHGCAGYRDPPVLKDAKKAKQLLADMKLYLTAHPSNPFADRMRAIVEKLSKLLPSSRFDKYSS
jgi:hypothetical protein